MDYWKTEFEAVQQRIAEIEMKIGIAREIAQELQQKGADARLQHELISIHERSLARAMVQLQFIEKQIEVEAVRRAKRREISAIASSFIDTYGPRKS